jgi:hypothetical protein
VRALDCKTNLLEQNETIACKETKKTNLLEQHETVACKKTKNQEQKKAD